MDGTDLVPPDDPSKHTILTISPKSLDQFHIVYYLYRMGKYFLDIQYLMAMIEAPSLVARLTNLIFKHLTLIILRRGGGAN